MQQIVPTLAARNPNNHTQAEILAALRGKTGSRRLHFRYEVYNSSGTFLSELTGVVSGSIAYNSLADIKRTATFVIRDDGPGLGEEDTEKTRWGEWGGEILGFRPTAGGTPHARIAQSRPVRTPCR